MEFETKNHEPGCHDKIGPRGEKEHPLGQPSKRQLHQGGCCQATGLGLGQVRVKKTTASRLVLSSYRYRSWSSQGKKDNCIKVGVVKLQVRVYIGQVRVKKTTASRWM